MVGPKELTRLRLLAEPHSDGTEDGRGWHWSEALDGSPLLCLESLLSWVRTQERVSKGK
jgi:hypothetical protein